MVQIVVKGECYIEWYVEIKTAWSHSWYKSKSSTCISITNRACRTLEIARSWRSVSRSFLAHALLLSCPPCLIMPLTCVVKWGHPLNSQWHYSSLYLIIITLDSEKLLALYQSQSRCLTLRVSRLLCLPLPFQLPCFITGDNSSRGHPSFSSEILGFAWEYSGQVWHSLTYYHARHEQAAR